MKGKYYGASDSSSGDSSDDDEIMAKNTRTHKVKGRARVAQPVPKVKKKLREKDNQDREYKPSQSRSHAKVQSDLVPKRTLYHKTCDLNRMDLNWRKKLVQDSGHDTDWNSPPPPPPPDEQYPEASRKPYYSENPPPFQQPETFSRRRKKPRKRKQNPCYGPGPYDPNNAYCSGQPCRLGPYQYPCSNSMGGPTIIAGMPCAPTSSYYPPPGTQQVGYLMLGGSGYAPMMSGQLQYPLIMAQQLGSSPAYGTSVPGGQHHLGQALQGPIMVPGQQQYMAMSVAAGAPILSGFPAQQRAQPFGKQEPYLLSQPVHSGPNYSASPMFNRHPGGGAGFVMASAPPPGMPVYAAPSSAGPGTFIYGNGGALPPPAYPFPPGNPSTGPFQAVSFSQGAGYSRLPPISAGFMSKPY